MSRLDEWHARVEAGSPVEALEPLSALWIRLGVLARVALGKANSAVATQAAAGLLNDLQPLQAVLSPHERLLVAIALIEYHFAVGNFEHIDYLSNLVESAALFDAASPTLQALWVFTYGFGLYHVGDLDTGRKSLAARAGHVTPGRPGRCGGPESDDRAGAPAARPWACRRGRPCRRSPGPAMGRGPNAAAGRTAADAGTGAVVARPAWPRPGHAG